MAIVVQTDGSSGTVWPRTPTITTTTGNALIVMVVQGTPAGPFSVSDSLNGSYGSADVSLIPADGTAIFSKRNITGGSTTITVNGNNGVFGQVIVFEVSGLSNTATPTTGSQSNTPATTTHVSSSVGLTGAGFTLCSIVQGVITPHHPGTDYTNRDGASDSVWGQYRTTAISADQGPFTTDAVCTSQVTMALYANAGASFNLVRP